MGEQGEATDYTVIVELTGRQVSYDNKLWIIWRVNLDINDVELRRVELDEGPLQDNEKIRHVVLPVFASEIRAGK